jgi:hypothetical protein
MTAVNPPINAAAYIVYIALQDMSNPGSYKANPTLASGDVKISIDGGAFNNLATLPTITPAAGIAVKVSASGTEMTGDNIFIQFIDQTSPKEWADYAFNIQTTLANAAANIVQIDGVANTSHASGKIPADVLTWIGGAIPAVTVTGVPKVDIQDILGTVISTPATAGILDVNVKNIANAAVSTTSAQVGVNVVQYNTQTAATDANNWPKVDVEAWKAGVVPAVSVTGIPKVDMADILGTAVSSPATAGILDVNVKNMNNVAGTAITTVKAVQGLTTADTITTTTTATNLTNAPTNGDFTATMKTSLNAATPASVVGAVGSVTGAVGSVAAGGITNASFAANTGLVPVRANTAAAGAATTITLDAGASSVDSFYNGCLITITGSTGVGQSRIITGYVGSTQVATVDRAWATNPSGTSTFAILATDEAKIDDSMQVVSASVQGNVTGSVASVTGAVGSVTGAVGSVTGAVGSVTGAVGSVAAGGIANTSFAANTGLVPIRVSTAQAGAAGTITLDVGASATDSFYVGLHVLLTGATGAGQVRVITAYVGATKVATVDWNWVTNPDATSTFALLQADGPAVSSAMQVSTSASDPWGTALPGAYGAGTAGKIIGTNLDTTISSRTKPADTQARVTLVDTLTTYTGNTLQTGDSFARIGVAGAGLTAIPDSATVTEIGADVDELIVGVVVTTSNDKTGYALTAGERTSIADAMLDETAGVETGLTVRQWLRLVAAVLLGKISGAATNAPAFRDTNDTKTRVSATTDASGNRNSVTRDSS